MNRMEPRDVVKNWVAAFNRADAEQLHQEQITGDMMKQLGAAAELLNSEIDALERILVEH